MANLPITIETERTILRPMLETDLAGIFQTHSDPETKRFTWIDDLLGAEEILAWILRERAENYTGFQILSIMDKNNARFLGLCGLRMRKDLGNAVDIAYRIHPENRLKGIATETAAAVIDWGFQSAGLPRILAQVHEHNFLSHRVMQKLKFNVINAETEWWLYELRRPVAP